MNNYLEFFSFIEKKDHIIKKLPNLSDDEKEEVIEYFNKFTHAEKEIDWNKAKELTYADFKKVMDRESKSQRKKNIRQQKLGALEEGKDYLAVFDGSADTPEEPYENQLVGYIPLTYEASKVIASDVVGNCVGKWCTAYQKDPGYWLRYILDQNQTLVYFVYMGDPNEYDSYFQKVAAMWDEDEGFTSLFDATDEEHSVRSGLLSQRMLNIVDDRIRDNKLYDKVDRRAPDAKADVETFLTINSDATTHETTRGEIYIDSLESGVRILGNGGVFGGFPLGFTGFEEDVYIRTVYGRMHYGNLPNLTHLPANLIPQKIRQKSEGYDTEKLVFDMLVIDLKSLQSIDHIPIGVTHLHIKDCPKLTQLPPIPSSVEKISLHNVGITSLGDVKSLRNLEISNCKHLTSLGQLPQEMDTMVIHNCGLTSLEGSPTRMTDAYIIGGCESINSLEGGPREVGLTYQVYRSNLTSIVGFPTRIGFKSSRENVGNIELRGLSDQTKHAPAQVVVDLGVADRILAIKFYEDQDSDPVEVIGVAAKSRAAGRVPILGLEDLPFESRLFPGLVFVAGESLSAE